MAGLGFGDFKLAEAGLGLSDVGNSFSGVSDIVGGFGDFSQLSNSLGQSGYSGLFNSIDNSVGLAKDSGFLDSISGLGSILTGGLDSLSKYKDGISIASQLGLGLANYNTSKKEQEMQEEYYNSLIAEQQRQVANETKANDNMDAGLKASNYYNV